MERYILLSLDDNEKWNDYLRKLPVVQQDIFYSPDYYKIYEQYGDGKALCYVFEKNGYYALYPFLKNCINDLGYELDKQYYDIQGAYGYNGIVTSNQTSTFINEFYNSFKLFCKKENIIAEFTRFYPLLQNQILSSDHYKIIHNRNVVILTLTNGYEDIWMNQYSSTNRNMLRKAEKLNYSINIRSKVSDDDIESFLTIYHATMNYVSANKYYYFNKEYFDSSFEYLNGNIFMLDVSIDDNIACSGIIYIYGLYAHYHLSGINKSIADNAANNFLLDQAVKFAIDRKCMYFNFGGGNSLDLNDGLFRFKSNFSKQNMKFYIGTAIHNNKIYDKVLNQWKLKFDNQNVNSNYFLKYHLTH